MVDLKKFSGEHLTIALHRGEIDDPPIRDWAERFYEDTGITIDVIDVKPQEYLCQLMAGGRNRKSPYNLIASAPIWLNQLVVPGYYEDLAYLYANRELTMEETVYGMENDFFKNYMEYAAWYDPESQMPKSGKDSMLMAVPGTHTGCQILICRTDILDQYGLQIPETWEEFNEVVKRISQPKKGFYGTSLCGNRQGALPIIDWYPRLTSQGGRQFRGTVGERNLHSCALSEEGIRAYEWILDILPYTPDDYIHYTLKDGERDMLQGKIGMQINTTAFVFPDVYWDSQRSQVADRIEAVPVPGVGKYRGVAYGGGWAWSIMAAEEKKEAAWLAAQYFSSPEFDQYRCIRYGITPIRRSTIRNDTVRKAQPWVGCLEDIIDRAVEPEYFYLPEIYRIADIINRHLTQGIAAQRPAEKVLAELDQEVNELLRLGGWQL